MRDGEIKDMITSYSDNDLSAEFPSMQCYVGDTILFEDLSDSTDGSTIKTWIFNITVRLATAITSIIITYWESSKFELTGAGRNSFFSVLKVMQMYSQGSLDPWSENGNHR